MPCCVAHKYGNWCSTLPTLIVDDDEYCIYHAPSSAPKKPRGKKFSEFIDILLKSNKASRLDGTIFPDDIVLNLGYQNGPLSMRGCRFEGSVNLPYGDVAGDLVLSDSVFLNGISLGDQGIKSVRDKKAAITGVLTTKKRKEHGVKLKVAADFLLDGANIEGLLNIKNCSVGGALRICDSIVADRTNFASTVVKGDFDATNADFLDRVQMNDVVIVGKASFEKTQFDRECRLTLSVFQEGALFLFTKFRAQLFIQKTRFDKKVWFERVKFNEASFPLCHFGAGVIFNDVDLKTVSLLNAPVEDFCFLGCSWQEYKGRTVSIDLLKLKKPKKYKKIQRIKSMARPLKGKGRYTQPRALAELYRRLKKLARIESDELLASDWHYLEKEMLRYQIEADWPRFGGAVAFFSRTFLWAIIRGYRACSGYGESPARALVVLILFIGLTGIIPYVVETTPDIEVDHVFQAAWFLPLSKVDLKAAAGWSYWLKWVTSTLITAQGALLVFALRNKLRR